MEGLLLYKLMILYMLDCVRGDELIVDQLA